MTTLIPNLTPSESTPGESTPGDDSSDVVGSRLERIDPDNFRNQSGAAVEDGDASEDRSDGRTEDEALTDEPVDGDGDPTGEHDHHQDDNYALGGHVTRSGSV